MEGKIITCINHGSLVQVLIKTRYGLVSIPMDLRCFRNIIEVKGNINGKEIKYNEESKNIFFKEDLVK